MKSLFTVGAVLFGLFVHAKTPMTSEVPFSVNDFAILLPIDKITNLPKPTITVDSMSWKILSTKNFEEILKTADTKGVFLNQKLRSPKNWYLVGTRYSPCTIFSG